MPDWGRKPERAIGASKAQGPQGSDDSASDANSTKDDVWSPEVDNALTVVGASAVLSGGISGKGNVLVAGTVNGPVRMESDSLVKVAKGGIVKGAVDAGKVFINGTIVGNIKSTELVSMLEHGDVQGDIASKTVTLQEGGSFDGRIRMGDAAASSDKSNHGAKPDGGGAPPLGAKTDPLV